MSTFRTDRLPLIKEKGDGTDEKIVEKLTPAYLIASEIVKDIVDDAVTIGLQKNKSNVCQHFNKIDANFVGDILNNIMLNATKNPTKDMKCPLDKHGSEATIKISDCPEIVNKSETIIREKVRPVKRFTNFVRYPTRNAPKAAINNDLKASTSQNNQNKQEEILGDCKQRDILDLIELKGEENCSNEDQSKGDKEIKKKMGFIEKLMRYFRKNPRKEPKSDE